MRSQLQFAILLAATLLTACIGNKTPSAGLVTPPPPTANTLAVTVDTGPPSDPGQINLPYVTVKVCAPGSTTQCASIDHVLLDTGSWGLRLVRSVLTAGGVTLSAETDAQGQSIEECESFLGGQTWGPVALADITLAGEVAAKLPVQIMDDTNAGAAPPKGCGTNGLLLNAVTGFHANGLMGIGVFAQDCGSACANAATPMLVYYGCTSAGVCTAENVALSAQVTNPIAQFSTDNNGLMVNFPNLINANGDTSVTGQIIFGLSTQADNALPGTGLTVLGADVHGDFTATYIAGSGVTTTLPALIDSGTDVYDFDDSTIAPCASPPGDVRWAGGYYCPAVAPQKLSAMNTGAAGAAVPSISNTVDFVVADPNTFVSTASAFVNLGGGRGSSRFIWGMPFFYGRKVYIGIEGKAAGSYTGPYYAY